ncbi:MAG: hypothetical protein ABI813_11935 [Bacteroidota bacterium]
MGFGPNAYTKPATGLNILRETITKPGGSSFDDISKISNREDKNIVFAVDADTTLHDFYWRHNRGLSL